MFPEYPLHVPWAGSVQALGVSVSTNGSAESATRAQIHLAYRAAALKFHPDRALKASLNTQVY